MRNARSVRADSSGLKLSLADICPKAISLVPKLYPKGNQSQKSIRHNLSYRPFLVLHRLFDDVLTAFGKVFCESIVAYHRLSYLWIVKQTC